ncbi:PAS domain S-box protein [Rubrivirga sp.]|uniref:PAS domain S-box protein n=1 Tax=Rubrivirga sp. TaxID=1885344 RepID=UPI003B52F9B6
MPAALLFATAAGSLRVVAAAGSWGGNDAAIRALAERLGDAGLDALDGAVDGARFAASARLGDGEGALLVFAPDDRALDEAWAEAFATSAALALGLVRAAPGRLDPGRLLHEVAVHPGTFEERLDLALQRATEALGLDGAVLAHVDGGMWTPHTVYDPSQRLIPVRPVPLDQTFCAVTSRTDGPFAVEDAAQAALDVDGPAVYLGAPVFVHGRCVGTFCVVGGAPRSRPFSPDDRALVESLARWAGSALEGATTARLLADREADLAAFFDGAPLGMGVIRLVDGAVEFVRVNATAAAALGTTPAALAGRSAADVGLGGDLERQWVAACRRALTEGHAQRFEMVGEGDDGARTLSTTVAQIDADEHARFAFVVEDVTGRHRAAERAREREAQIEALMAHAPVALFAADDQGRLVMSRGRALDLLGLSIETSEGRPLTELFDGAEAAAGIEAALVGRDADWTVEAGDRTFEVRVLGHRDGRPSGLIGVALDVTEHLDGARAATAAAHARQALLTHLDREIRSPLTSILGYADLLNDQPTPEELAELRGVIGRAGDRLRAALDELTLLGGEAVASPPVPTDVAAVLAAVADASRPAAHARRVALNVWCTLPEAPLLLDAALFERLARTLVSGAVASAQGPRVDVRLQPADRATFEMTVTGGAPASAFGLREGYVPRLAEALGGRAWLLDGEHAGWRLRLPRRSAPVVEFPALNSDASPADGASGEAPTVAVPATSA